MTTFARRLLQEIAAAPSWRVAEAVIDAYHNELAVLEPAAKEALLCQVADLIAELPREDN